jgi:serine phosphatase RsbU (regulator of sigma subunit)/PAS domain-containing protein
VSFRRLAAADLRPKAGKMAAVSEPAITSADVEALRAEVIALQDRLAAVQATASRVEAGLAYLATASVALAASLDVDATLVTLGNLAVPRLADACAIHLRDSKGPARLVAVQHLDPAKTEVVRRLFVGQPSLDDVLGVDGALQTGAIAFRPRLGEELPAEAGGAEPVPSLRLGSSVVVPLTARGSRLGTLTLLTEEGRLFGEAEVALAEELAWRAAIALDNARLHEASERAKARQAYQATLLRWQAEAGLDGLVVISPDQQMIEFNRRFREIWQLPPGLLEGGSAEEFLTWAAGLVVDPAAFVAGARDAGKTSQPIRDEIRLRDGRVLDRYGAPLVDEAGNCHGWAWYFRDVTDQKRWEQVLLESSERFAALARTLQQSLLPPDLPDVPGLELAAMYHPAGGGTEVGGDFYDVFQTGRQAWALVMGDVCGRGAEAARTTGLARYTLRAGAMQARRPSEILTVLNEALIRQQSEDPSHDPRFVTAAYARLRLAPGRVGLTVALGGHPQPLLLRHDGRVRPLGVHGTALGLVRQPEFHDREARLTEGDLVVFYTDGVTDAQSLTTGEEFGEHRLRKLLAGLRASSAAEVASAVHAAVLGHLGGRASDDMAVLISRVAPRS